MQLRRRGNLAGCGGSQPPISASGAIPQARAAQHSRGGSWMLPETTSSGALIYAIGDGGNAYIYTYPGGQPVTGIALELTIDICSDLSGNVYITDTGGGSNGAIRIYAHGSTNTQDILAFNGYPGSCSVDAKTGNLAVTNNAASGSGDIGIYQNAEGSPTYYTATNITHYISCAYDDQGNLFVDGNDGSSQVLDEMPQGSTDLVPVSLNKALRGAFGRLQWQGSYLAMGLGATNTIITSKCRARRALPPARHALRRFRVGGSRAIRYFHLMEIVRRRSRSGNILKAVNPTSPPKPTLA